MKSIGILVRNALLICASLAAALMIAEVGVRFIAPQPTGLSDQDRFGLAMHYPGITRYLPQYGHEVSFNSAGMRDREHITQKPPGVFRILLLGDSFMEALQVPFEESVPSMVERALQEQTGKCIEVVSAGVGGWGTDDELRYLTNYGLKYQPDLVVVAMTLHNDISDNLRLDWHRLEAGALVDQPRPEASFFSYRVTQLKAYIATRFQIYQLWRRVRHGGEIRQVGKQLNTHVVQLFREPNSVQITSGIVLTRLLLGRIQAETDSAGGRVVLVLLPLKYQLSDSVFAAFVRSSEIPAQQMQLDKPQTLITEVADSLGIPVIDLLPAFRRWTADTTAPLYLEWDGHWNSAGHRLAAGEITRQLVGMEAVR